MCNANICKRILKYGPSPEFGLSLSHFSCGDAPQPSLRSALRHTCSDFVKRGGGGGGGGDAATL